MTSAAAKPPRIRLSIFHLMLWTVGSALVLACFRVLSNRSDELPKEIAQLQPFYHVAYSLTLRAQVGSVLLFAVRRVNRQVGFPSQPGHWLLLVEGISATLMLAGYGLFAFWFNAASSDLRMYFALQIPNLVACTSGYAIAAANSPKATPWRLSLGSVAILYGIQLCLFTLSAWTSAWSKGGGSWHGIWELPQNCLGVTLGIVVLMASLADLRNHGTRDYLHWTGIATFIGNIALQFLFQAFVIGG